MSQSVVIEGGTLLVVLFWYHVIQQSGPWVENVIHKPLVTVTASSAVSW